MHTKTGPLKIELRLSSISQCKHAENFIRHCAKGTYNDNRILRYIPNFIIQTGDPSQSGKESHAADPENNTTNGPLSKEFQYSNAHGWNQIKRGTLLTVNNDKHEDGLGSQFFISLSSEHQAILGDISKYTVIGMVIDGYETIEKLESDESLNDKDKMKKSGKPRGIWKKESWIKHVEIHYNPFVEQ